MPARSLNQPPASLSGARFARTMSCLLLACGLLWLTLPGAARAADTTTDITDDPDWTGKRQGPAEARKEAFAALAQGRRECQRERKPDERKACVKQVEDDHAATMKRLQAGAAKR